MKIKYSSVLHKKRYCTKRMAACEVNIAFCTVFNFYIFFSEFKFFHFGNSVKIGIVIWNNHNWGIEKIKGKVLPSHQRSMQSCIILMKYLIILLTNSRWYFVSSAFNWSHWKQYLIFYGVIKYLFFILVSFKIRIFLPIFK